MTKPIVRDAFTKPKTKKQRRIRLPEAVRVFLRECRRIGWAKRTGVLPKNTVIPEMPELKGDVKAYFEECGRLGAAIRTSNQRREMVCSECGKEFITFDSKTKTCGNACRQAAYRSRKAAKDLGETLD